MPARFALALLLVSGAAAAQDTQSLAGTYRLNRAQSDDIAEKMKISAGSASMKGGPSWATETWFPWGGGFSEGQRISVREFLLATVPVLQSLEIEVGADELKTIHGPSGVRRFYLSRASAGTSAIDGQKVTRQARWQEAQLVLESKGKDGKLVEVLTPVPTRGQLAYALKLDQKLLKSPLDLKLVYDKVEAR